MLATPLAAEFEAARRAFNEALDHAAEFKTFVVTDAGRRYLRAKLALIGDVLANGEVETRTHRYGVRWDAHFRRWQLVAVRFVRFPSLAARREAVDAA